MNNLGLRSSLNRGIETALSLAEGVRGMLTWDEDTHSEYQPIPNISFVPQDPKCTAFNHNLASWLINANIYAYLQFSEEHETVPKEVTNIKKLYWHTPWNILNRPIYAGFIGTICVDNNVNRIIVSIRGTQTKNEWISNLKYGLTPILLGSCTRETYVHTGFWETFSFPATKRLGSLKEQIHRLLPEYLSQTLSNEIYVVGHSLGAAVATLMSIDIAISNPTARVIHYNFGSPRVGDPSFQDVSIEALQLSNSHFMLWRTFNTEDLITNVPFSITPDILNKDHDHFKVFFQHTGYWNGSLQGVRPNIFFGGFSFSNNLQSAAANHSLLTYYSFGIWNGTKPVPSVLSGEQKDKTVIIESL
jgi:hypothetical protein